MSEEKKSTETIYSRRRRKLGLTNGKIAKALDVSESYISKIMHGHREPLIIEERLREYLGLPPRKTA